MWEKDLVCKFCQTPFHITELDVIYADLRDPLFLVPDYQYFVICIMCDGKLIQTEIPSSTAVEIQERTNAERNKSTDN